MGAAAASSVSVGMRELLVGTGFVRQGLVCHARAAGVAATSHIAGRRFARPRRLKDYEAWVQAGAEGAYTLAAATVQAEELRAGGQAQVPAAAASAGPGALTSEEEEERLTDMLMLVRPMVQSQASSSLARAQS